MFLSHLTNGDPTPSQPDAWAEVNLISACACGNQIQIVASREGAMWAILTPYACSPTLNFLCVPLYQGFIANTASDATKLW